MADMTAPMPPAVADPQLSTVPADPTTGGVAPVEAPNTPTPQPMEEEEEEQGEEEEEDDGLEGTVASSGAARELAIAAARKQLGVPSVIGGGNEDGPSVGPGQDPERDEVGFDSPGFVGYCLAQAGIEAPTSSLEQSEMGPRVLVSEAVPGDLVAFNDGEDIAILVDDGVIIQAPDEGGAVEKEEVDDLDEAWGVSLESHYEN